MAIRETLKFPLWFLKRYLFINTFQGPKTQPSKVHGVHVGFRGCSKVLELTGPRVLDLGSKGHMTWCVSVNRQTAGCLRNCIRIAQASGLSAEWNSSAWGAYGGQEGGKWQLSSGLD